MVPGTINEDMLNTMVPGTINEDMLLNLSEVIIQVLTWTQKYIKNQSWAHATTVATIYCLKDNNCRLLTLPLDKLRFDSEARTFFVF